MTRMFWAALILCASSAQAQQIIDFEIPPQDGEVVENCRYPNPVASCGRNTDTNWTNGIGQLNTFAIRQDGDRVCGNAAQPAHTGSCYVSFLDNATVLPGDWNGSVLLGAPDRQGQVFNVSATGVGARSITAYSRANATNRADGFAPGGGGFSGGDGRLSIYTRNTTAGLTGWTLLTEQVCTNTAAWTACTVNFTIPPSAQQVALTLSPHQGAVRKYMTVDFDTVDVSKLFPDIAALDNPLPAMPAVGGTTASVLGNDTANGQAALLGTGGNVTLAPGTLGPAAPAAGGIAMNADGTITVQPGTTPGLYTYSYQICASPAVTPPVCSSAQATLTVLTVPPVIVATDDPLTPTPMAATGGTTASVLDNDTVDGQPAVVGASGNVTLAPGTLGPAPAAGGIAMNADGTVTVQPGTTPGTYTYTYDICPSSALSPRVCATATATVTVQAAVVVATTPAPVPTLAQWATWLLVGLLAWLGARRLFMARR